MAGFLAYALAGATSGLGQGMIEEAKARREQVLEDLREQRLMAREDRAFDRQGQRDDRLYGQQTQRDERQREFTASESAKTRAGQGTLAQDAEGNNVRIGSDNIAAPILNADGTRFTSAKTSGLSAEENNLWKSILETNTVTTPNPMGSMFEPQKSVDREAVEAQLRRANPTLHRKIFGADAAPAPEAPAPAAGARAGAAISSEPIAVNSAADVANLADGQPVIYKGENYTWNAKKRGFDPVGGGANSEDAAPTPPRRQAAPTAEQPAREAQRPLTDVIRNSPAGSFLRENATGPLSGSRSDNADAPEERTQYGRETALNSQAVQRNQRDPQRDRLARQRNAVIEEIRRLEGLMRAGRIRQPEFNRAMARFEADLARLDQESAR
jgi:hypothetical protein